jgi:starch phosphorylase
MDRPWREIQRLHVAEIELAHELRRLYDLAYNLWWTWDTRARRLFAAVDPRTWALYRNPVQLLLSFDRSHWHQKLEDEGFMALYHAVLASFDRYLAGESESWWAKHHPDADGPIAYFCMEYGLHQSLPIYSGGLGVLAGDHLKSASDLGVPLVAVGLLYRSGYFHQTIDADGRQQHLYPDIDFSRLPVRPASTHTGRQVLVRVPFPGREIAIKVWVAEVGRVPLLLLDTDLPENDAADRPIASMLYTPGREMRLAQEVVLGVGGARALAELSIEPRVWHMNEGHSALLQWERLRRKLARGASFDDALAEVRRGSVFTTHTPVPAGNESFDPALAKKYFAAWCATAGVPLERWLSLAANDHGEPDQPFNMTALAIRTSARINGVSAINAEVASRMWHHLFPESTPAEERIAPIANGVHAATWLGAELQELFMAWFGEAWRAVLGSDLAKSALAGQPDAELWRAHAAQKQRLARFLRSRLREQFARHGLAPDDLRAIERMFDPEVLTIGFARRFTTYKRAGLLFSDLHRLRTLVTHPARPVQIVLAGKAHPADKEGQELIQSIFRLSQEEKLKGRVFYVEDYDMRVGRMLVQGVDVWLNTPRRPMEASGTSGMKAAMNGALNCSISDGWWPEGYDGTNGWVIECQECPLDPDAADREDAATLYRLLEEEVVPAFYERDGQGLPRSWIARMKAAIATISPRFSSDRMVRDYSTRAYLPLLRPPEVAPPPTGGEAAAPDAAATVSASAPAPVEAPAAAGAERPPVEQPVAVDG